MNATRRYVKRVGPKGVTVWTWTEQLSKRSDCFEISEKEALHLMNPEKYPAPPNITNLENLDPNLFTMLEGLTKEQQKQLMVLMGQVQHGQTSAPTPEVPATALDMSTGVQTPDTVGKTKETYEDQSDEESEPQVNSNGRPSVGALNRMTKAQLQEHSAKHFPDKPEFDIEDPNNTNDFMREKINEWWNERERV